MLLLIGFRASAQLRLPSLFDDHMVIQQQSRVPFWGWAGTVQDIRITVSWDTTTFRTKSANTTFWTTEITTPDAGGPHTITIKAGNETRTLQDVMSGEVWLCSGQSNMEWSMAASADGREVMSQVNDSQIRLFHVPKSAATTLQQRGEGTWRVANKESVSGFSAVGYFFGKKLSAARGVPVGLLNVSWGGTPAEVWLPTEKVMADQALRASAAKQVDDKPWCPSRSGVVFNAMINPLIPFTIAGALWYQGEANTAAPHTYKHLMETLVLDWRRQFKSDFPFYYVQIAPFSGYGTVEKGTLVREQQVKMLEIPNTGMVVISDLVDDVNDIHPKFKKPVGERLANLALADHYRMEGVVYQGPLYSTMQVEKSRIRISFNHAPNGLISKDGPPTEFMIAGEDRQFYTAKAKIEGNAVIVSAKEVRQPVAVRFAWGNGSIPNLYNKEDLPASCFRTDDWDIEVP
jgi:sialate O-acetylesterase